MIVLTDQQAYDAWIALSELMDADNGPAFPDDPTDVARWRLLNVSRENTLNVFVDYFRHGDGREFMRLYINDK